MELKPLILNCIVFIKVCYLTAVMIRNPPSNATVLEGRDVKFYCDVIEKRPTDYVFWKKMTLDGFTDVLSYNEVSMNQSKYIVRDYYSIIIKNVDLLDEAWYECQAGIDRSRAMLTVNVMMDNMTLVWGNSPTSAHSSLVNLTCHVYHSRPPADITWFHGTTELTSISSTCQKSSNVDGFGDTVCTLTTVVDSANDNLPYRCVATLPDTGSSRTEMTFASKTLGLTSGSDVIGGNLIVTACIVLVMYL